MERQKVTFIINMESGIFDTLETSIISNIILLVKAIAYLGNNYKDTNVNIILCTMSNKNNKRYLDYVDALLIFKPSFNNITKDNLKVEILREFKDEKEIKSFFTSKLKGRYNHKLFYITEDEIDKSEANYNNSSYWLCASKFLLSRCFKEINNIIGKDMYY